MRNKIRLRLWAVKINPIALDCRGLSQLLMRLQKRNMSSIFCNDEFNLSFLQLYDCKIGDLAKLKKPKLSATD